MKYVLNINTMVPIIIQIGRYIHDLHVHYTPNINEDNIQ